MFNESINYSCDLEFGVYENNVLIKTVKKSNIVTNFGKLTILSRLCNPSPPHNYLNKMVFGDSTSIPTVLDSLSDFGNYVINNTRGHKLNLITEDSVELYWELGESEYNGKTLKTVGLFSISAINAISVNNPPLAFNRVLFLENDYILKTPSTKLVGKWIIRLTQTT